MKKSKLERKIKKLEKKAGKVVKKVHKLSSEILAKKTKLTLKDRCIVQGFSKGCNLKIDKKALDLISEIEKIK